MLASLNTPHARNAINQASSQWAGDYLHRFRPASIHFIAHTLQRKPALLQCFLLRYFFKILINVRLTHRKSGTVSERQLVSVIKMSMVECNNIVWVDVKTLHGMLFTYHSLQGSNVLRILSHSLVSSISICFFIDYISP